MVVGMSRPVAAMKFDASLDITDAKMPTGFSDSDAAAVERVRAAVAALPGAGWVSAGQCAV